MPDWVTKSFADLGARHETEEVSTVPGRAAAVGVAIQTPLEDRFLQKEAGLRDRMTVLLAGRAAEPVIYGAVSTGPVKDLHRVAQMAGLMLTQYGMSEKLGPIALEALFRDMRRRAVRPTCRIDGAHSGTLNLPSVEGSPRARG